MAKFENIMKKNLLLMLSIFYTGLTLNAQNKSKSVEDYTSIKTSLPVNIFYDQKSHDDAYVRIEADNDLVKNLSIESVKGVLVIKSTKKIKLNKNSILNIYTSSRSLEKIESTGAGDISLNTSVQVRKLEVKMKGSGNFKANDVRCNNLSIKSDGSGDVNLEGRIQVNKIEIDLKGAGNMNASNIKSDKSSFSINGSGNMIVAGETVNLSVKVKGSGGVNLKDFEAKNVSAELDGSGGIIVNATNDLSTKLKGSGLIEYIGSSKNIKKEIKGSGEILKISK